MQVPMDPLLRQAELQELLDLAREDLCLLHQVVNGLPGHIQLWFGHLLVEQLLRDCMVHLEELKVGRDGGLHIKLQLPHGTVQLTGSPADLLWAGGLCKLARDDVKHTALCTVGQQLMGASILAGEGAGDLDAQRLGCKLRQDGVFEHDLLRHAPVVVDAQDILILLSILAFDKHPLHNVVDPPSGGRHSRFSLWRKEEGEGLLPDVLFYSVIPLLRSTWCAGRDGSALGQHPSAWGLECSRASSRISLPGCNPGVHGVTVQHCYQ
mmetsp:Transcript_8587/g.23067  ORF Transcript_8587/g.23067 Transcript_8587/m.23067 type:complete len:266 (+) Transcript_8587:715-1512(+)